MKIPFFSKVAAAFSPKTIALPAWARVVDSDKACIKIEVDTAAAYQEWFAKLNVTNPDQYWLEVAYQCTKMQLQDALVGTQYDPRTAGKPAIFHFTRSPEHALTKHPTGKGARAATQGREAREHFKRIHGRLPW